ncbi:MAG: hypothetical protein LRZ85_02575 [Alphaproteobacteria bacterium]|nr:hypothetical protein [Alphaproteobacteria bacterium]
MARISPKAGTQITSHHLKSLFWNPRWNESLFLVSCAERLMNGEEDFAREEIFRRIQREEADGGFIQFRLVFQAREGDAVQKHIVYTSPVRACEKAGAA